MGDLGVLKQTQIKGLIIWRFSIKIATSQARFKWTDDKCLQEFESSMEFRNCDSTADKVKIYESERKSLNRCI